MPARASQLFLTLDLHSSQFSPRNTRWQTSPKRSAYSLPECGSPCIATSVVGHGGNRYRGVTERARGIDEQRSEVWTVPANDRLPPFVCPSAIGKTGKIDMRTGTGSLCDLQFGCNASGAGPMIRLDV